MVCVRRPLGDIRRGDVVVGEGRDRGRTVEFGNGDPYFRRVVAGGGIVVQRKEMPLLKDVPKNDLLFLCLSGVATAASWLCYYYAIRQGQVSVVVSIDKASVLLTVLFSACVLHEKISKRAWIGLALLTCGALFMAIIVA